MKLVRSFVPTIVATFIFSICIIGYTSTFAHAQSLPTPMGDWTFDETSGTTASDSSTNGNTGTLTGTTLPTWVSDSKVGTGALSFTDGGYVSVGSPSSLNIPGALTISAWVKRTNGGYIVSNNGNSTEQYAFSINSTNGKLQFEPNYSASVIAASTSLAINTWYHVAVVRSGSTGNWTITFYVNGIVDGTPVTISANPDASGPVYIGHLHSGGGYYFNGSLDDVRVYNTALNLSQIDELYALGGGVPNSFILTYTAGTYGSITGSASQTVISGNNGSAVTATPDTGYRFLGWSDGSKVNPRTDTNVTGNISVTASFISNSIPVPTCEAVSPHNCWYIDNSLPTSGFHDGSTWETAWTNIGDMSVIGGGLIQPGDYVYISGGDTTQTYNMPQNFQGGSSHYWSPNIHGTSGNPITFKVGQDTHHNGTIVFDGNNTISSSGVSPENCVNDNNSYLIFDGNYQGQEHFSFVHVKEGLALTSGCHDVTLRYSNINNGGVSANGAVNIEVDHNTIDMRGSNGGTSKITIVGSVHDNYILALRGPYEGTDGVNPGEGSRIYNNRLVAVYDPTYMVSDHQDGVQTWDSNVEIYNNLFENWTNSCIFFAPYPYSDYHLDHVYIYNNTCINSDESIAFGNNEGARLFRQAFIQDGDVATSTFKDADPVNGESIRDGLLASGVLEYALTGEVRLSGNGPVTRPAQISGSNYDAIWAVLSHTLYNKGNEIYEWLMTKGYSIEWATGPNGDAYPVSLDGIGSAEQADILATYPAQGAEVISLINTSLLTAYAYVTNSVFANNTIIDGNNGFDFLECDPQACPIAKTLYDSSDLIYNNLIYNHMVVVDENHQPYTGPSTQIASTASNGNNLVVQEPNNTHFANYTYSPPLGDPTLFNPANYDAHLISSATDLIGQGTNLSSYFTTDITGLTRPASGQAWDIGAYQYCTSNCGTSSYLVIRSTTGTGSGNINCIGTCPSSVVGGTQITFTASSTNGSTFTGWSGGTCSGTTNPCTVTVNSNITVTASFTSSGTPPPSTTYTAGSNGSLTGSSTQVVTSGSSGSAVTAVANAGYHFVNWSDSSTANPRTDTNVTNNISVTASFTADGGGTPACTGCGCGGCAGGGGGGGYVPPAATTTAATCPTGLICAPKTLGLLTTSLSLGSSGAQVTILQKVLVSEGLIPLKSITGYYGPITQAAVRTFQTTYKIVSSGTPSTTGFGTVGVKTRTMINKFITQGKYQTVVTPSVSTTPTTPSTFTIPLKLGDTNPEVTLLQTFLNTHGYPVATTGTGSSGHESTYFGPATQAALIAYQKANNITPALGFFGTITMGRMNGR